MRSDVFVVCQGVRTRFVERLTLDGVIEIPSNCSFGRPNQNATGGDYTWLSFQTFDQLTKEFATRLDRVVLVSSQSQLHRQHLMRIESKRHAGQIDEGSQNKCRAR